MTKNVFVTENMKNLVMKKNKIKITHILINTNKYC